MKNTIKTLSLLSLALVLGACGRGNPAPQHEGTKLPANMTIPAEGRWFVELEGDPTALSAQSVGSQQATFRAQAAQRGIRYQEVASYRTLFNGFSVLAKAGEINRIAQMPGVLAVYPVNRVELPKLQPDLRSAIEPQMFNAKGMTGADVAQNELGLTGQGIKVAVIDSGIDMQHPAFTGRVAGYDFVGDDYGKNGEYVAVPDDDPDDCRGHGTHVAGIIGGNDPATGFKGVAPGVKFGAYRVFGCEGSTYDDILLQAMERAYADGMNVINMSLGSAYDNWSKGATQQAASRLVKKGVVVVASAGNSGTTGQYSMGGVTMGENVISVASVENLKVTVDSFTITPDGSKVGYLPATGAPLPTAGQTFTITKKPTSTTTTTNDGCTASGGFAAGSLTGKAVLIRRGTCTFREKALNAQGAGAKAVILYNNQPGLINPTVEGAGEAVTIPVVFIQATDGAKIDSLIAGGTSLTFGTDKVSVANPPANTLADSSSYGMSAELELKPDIAAPGGNIYSTYPLSEDPSGYASMSGTSMASPHVAGAAALMLQAFPGTKAKDMRALLMNTATLRWFRSGNTVYTGYPDYVQRQGAGMVDIVAAYHNPVRATPSKLSLGESGTFAVRSKVVVLKNTSATAQTYDAYHYPALTIAGTTLAPSPSTKTATMTINGQDADADVVPITVPANGETELNLLITPPAAAADHAQYGGYVVLESATGSSLIVPYSGFKGDYQSIQVLGDLIISGTAYNFPALLDDKEGYFYEEGEAVSAIPDFTMAEDDQPQVLAQLSHQSRWIKFEVLDSSSNVISTTKLDYWSRNCTNDISKASDTCRAYSTFTWDGKLSNGNNAPNGVYKLKLTVLKALGDESNPDHIETYTSQNFAVIRP